MYNICYTCIYRESEITDPSRVSPFLHTEWVTTLAHSNLRELDEIMTTLAKVRSFDDWLRNPSFEESVCFNPFHTVVSKVYDGYNEFDPFKPDPSHVHTKIGQLLRYNMILLEGDVIYVREGSTLHPLNEATSLLAYYLHSDTKEARKAADILESNFMGYFPVTQNAVIKNAIDLCMPDRTVKMVDISTLLPPEQGPLTSIWPEYGSSMVSMDRVGALAEFFGLINEAVCDEFFAEKMLMYPFKQKIREKSHVLVGNGGNGKSMLMRMANVLYGERSLVDAPQPKFSGHDAAVIAYSFVGKRVVTFNDVEKPSVAFLEWLKRMITGNLEVKTPSGAWLSVPCNTNFFMESNHTPEILDIEAHRRRYIIRTFDSEFKLAEEMAPQKLDLIGERGTLTAADIVYHLMNVKDKIESTTGWQDFGYSWEEEVAE